MYRTSTCFSANTVPGGTSAAQAREETLANHSAPHVNDRILHRIPFK